MASFRALDPSTFHISLPQAELDVKEGIVQLDGLADDVRAQVENELKRLKTLVEQVETAVVQPVVADATQAEQAVVNTVEKVASDLGGSK